MLYIFLWVLVAAYEEQERDAQLAAMDVWTFTSIQNHLLISSYSPGTCYRQPHCHPMAAM